MTKIPAPTASCQWSFLGLLDCSSSLALESHGRTVGALVTALSTASLSFLLQIVLFVVLRSRLPRVYRPIFHPTSARTTPTSTWNSLRVLLCHVLTSTNTVLLQKRGIDAYFFLRYLEMLAKIILPATLVALPILIPLNVYGSSGAKGLDILTTSNVAPSKSRFLWAHLVLTMAFTVWSCTLILQELQHYIRTRHTCMKSSSISDATVLIRDIPPGLLQDDKLRQLYDGLPGGVWAVSMNRNVGSLPKKIDQREKVVRGLEQAETSLLQQCTQRRSGFASGLKRRWQIPWREISSYETTDLPKIDDDMGEKWISEDRRRSSITTRHVCDIGCVSDEGHPAWLKYVPAARRRTRLPLRPWLPRMPFFGRQVDSICYLRCCLAHLNQEIGAQQQQLAVSAPLNSAVIFFRREQAASLCCQTLAHHAPFQMRSRWARVEAEHLIWENLGLAWWQRGLRRVAAVATLLLLTSLYSVPIACISFLNRISLLARVVPWLSWIDRAPSWMVSAVQGVLPPVLLNIMLTVVPLTIRFLVQMQGVPTTIARDQQLQSWYFLFLFMQVFVVVTLSGSFVETLTTWTDHGLGAIQRMVIGIPKASTFFLSYLAVEGLSSSATALVQLDSLLEWFLWAPMLDRTPREKWKRRRTTKTLDFGSVLPPLTNLAVIAIGYSLLSPLILVFAAGMFTIQVLVYRHNVEYVYDLKDTRGQFFPTAVLQTFTGLYVLQLCMTGRFLAQADGGRPVCMFQAALMLATMVGTAAFHLILYVALQPVFSHKAMTLFSESGSREHDGFQHAESSSGSGSGPVLVPLQARRFEHPSLQAQRPVVWLPKDKMGVSDDEVLRANSTRSGASSVTSNQNSDMDADGYVTVRSSPPDVATP